MQTQIVVFKVDKKPLNLTEKLRKKINKLFNKKAFNFGKKLRKKIIIEKTFK